MLFASELQVRDNNTLSEMKNLIFVQILKTVDYVEKNSVQLF